MRARSSGGKRAIAGRSGERRGDSPAVYGSAEREVIKTIWLAAEQPCGKRLKAALALWLPHYEKRTGRFPQARRAKVWSVFDFADRAFKDERQSHVRSKQIRSPLRP